MFARGGGRRHYLDRPYNWAPTDQAELEYSSEASIRIGFRFPAEFDQSRFGGS